MNSSHSLLLVLLLHTLFIISPGPNFLIVSNQTLTLGRKAGMLTAVGVTLGAPFHIIFSCLGAFVILESFFNILPVLKIIFGSFFLYLGLKGISTKKNTFQNQNDNNERVSIGIKNVAIGAVCGIFNPKNYPYYLSLFTIVLIPQLLPVQIILYSLLLISIEIAWFLTVAMALSIPKIKLTFLAHSHWVNRVFGVIMLVFGLIVLEKAFVW